MRLDWKVLGCAIGGFLTISYVLRVSYDFLSGPQSYPAWVDLLPGFHWLSWSSFALVETIAYAVFFGLVFAPLYNFFFVEVWRQS